MDNPAGGIDEEYRGAETIQRNRKMSPLRIG